MYVLGLLLYLLFFRCFSQYDEGNMNYNLTFRRRDLNTPVQCHRAEIFRAGF